jgi:hypothetical protein
MTGYYWGRIQIEENYFLSTYSFDKNYKATMLSIKAQITSLIEFITMVAIGFVMNIDYKIGFVVLSVSLFVLLAITYSTLMAYEKKKNSET